MVRQRLSGDQSLVTMGRGTPLIADVHDFDAPRAKRIGNQSAVTTPPGGFRTHERGASLLAKLEKRA
ncbi:MAG TPA: hypothetical protein VJ690_01655 [Burkholderiales bacterium]|nr:hypothetical protein [Burkholderiales bacterium]